MTGEALRRAKAALAALADAPHYDRAYVIAKTAEHLRAFERASEGETSMYIHNVADYAPTGHQLLRTEYEGGATRHVFRTPEGGELACEVRASSADEERAQLEAFKAEVSAPSEEPAGNA